MQKTGRDSNKGASPFQFSPSLLFHPFKKGQSPQNSPMKFTVPQHQPPASLGQNLASPTNPPMNPQYRGGRVTQAPIPSFPAMHGMIPGRQMNIPVTQQILPPALPPNVVTPERVVDPNMIPITSLAQYRGPPQWGVIKVSNVSVKLTCTLLGNKLTVRRSHIMLQSRKFLSLWDAVHIFLRLTLATLFISLWNVPLQRPWNVMLNS